MLVTPRLDHCPEGLPQAAYLSADWFSREMATVFAKNWVMVGRLADLAPGRLRRHRVGAAEVIVCRVGDEVAAYHNSCRHRGAEICSAPEQPIGKLISCPYHAWSYAAADGRLISTGHAVPTADFDRGAHGLHRVAVRLWNGFIFLNLSATPGRLRADMPLETLDNWGIDGLVTGHRWQSVIACNWKVFWENYSECLHCPGVHPSLSALVPVYARGIMAANEAVDWREDQPPAPLLRDGAESWTPSGALCGPVFPGLTPDERQRGHVFVTLWPSAYVVAHPDYLRVVRVEPVAPDRTRLVAEFLFSPQTLSQPGFDPAGIASFATTVLAEDGVAAEMNQRGIASPAFTGARLMPEEYEIHHFHQWLLTEMEPVP
jgi:Rieske 2Fe-2S family protein